ncbi:MAG: hypothetical protein ACTSQ8_23700 [Candidatus Helarchaeota archaeon]
MVNKLAKDFQIRAKEVKTLEEFCELGWEIVKAHQEGKLSDDDFDWLMDNVKDDLE